MISHLIHYNHLKAMMIFFVMISAYKYSSIYKVLQTYQFVLLNIASTPHRVVGA